jgi:hypothetical protein
MADRINAMEPGTAWRISRDVLRDLPGLPDWALTANITVGFDRVKESVFGSSFPDLWSFTEEPDGSITVYRKPKREARKRLVILDEAGSDNPLGRDAAREIERLTAERDALEGSGDAEPVEHFFDPADGVLSDAIRSTALRLAVERGGQTCPVSSYDISRAKELVTGEVNEINRLKSTVSTLTRQLEEARGNALEEAAKIADGEVVHHRYRTWPWWGDGNRANESELTQHSDHIAAAIRSLKQP